MDFDILNPEEEKEFEPYSPHARFEIHSDKEGSHYLVFLDQLLTEMLEQADVRNRYVSTFDDVESGLEGGIGGVYIKGKYFVGCKMYWFDGEPRRTPTTWLKCMLLRDHEDKGSYTVQAIFFFADSFAEFLTTKQIPFRLLVRKRSDRKEICRAQFPV
ncbi:MAG: hypothetical protein Q7R65_04825 [bacterium]|nr:hypothetical protein [bacterium]